MDSDASRGPLRVLSIDEIEELFRFSYPTLVAPLALPFNTTLGGEFPFLSDLRLGEDVVGDSIGSPSPRLASAVYGTAGHAACSSGVP